MLRRRRRRQQRCEDAALATKWPSTAPKLHYKSKSASCDHNCDHRAAKNWSVSHYDDDDDALYRSRVCAGIRVVAPAKRFIYKIELRWNGSQTLYSAMHSLWTHTRSIHMWVKQIHTTSLCMRPNYIPQLDNRRRGVGCMVTLPCVLCNPRHMYNCNESTHFGTTHEIATARLESKTPTQQHTRCAKGG